MHGHEELVLARLGSRFSLQFNPRARAVRSSPLGDGFARPLRLEISVLADGSRVVWPFSPGQSFDSFRIAKTMSSLEFTCVSVSLNLELAVKFTAPFYPRDERVSCAPFFYLDIMCRHLQEEERRIAEIKVSLFAREGETVSREGADVVLRGAYQLGHQGWGHVDDFSRQRFAGSIGLFPLRGRMTLKETTFSIQSKTGEEARAAFILAAHCEQPVLAVEGSGRRLHYLQWFPSVTDVFAFAKGEETPIREKVEFFDNLLAGSSLNQSDKDFVAGEFQSFLSTTWWTRDGGAEWFGCRDRYAVHNSVEDEYAASLFYLSFWPDLLEKHLVQRAEWALKSHDFPAFCGRFSRIDPLSAPAADACGTGDYILMLFSHWRWWDRFHLIEKYFSVVRKLSLSLLSFLDAQPLFFDREAVDSGTLLKLLCALHAAAVMAEEVGDNELAESLTLTLRDSDRFLETGHPPRGAADGLLHHVMCDHVPELDHRLIRRFFSAPLAENPLNGAFAAPRHLLHDITAAYFGFNLLQSQRYCNPASGREARPPRHSPSAGDAFGAGAVGIFQALLGLKLDRVERTLTLSPLCVPAHLPLIPLTDWENQRMPWVDIWCEGLLVKTDINGADLIEEKFDFGVDPHRELRCG